MKLKMTLFAVSISLATTASADMWGGFIDGAIGGAIIGGIIDGDDGAIDGSIIGGTIGAIDGAEREYQRDRNRYYDYRRYDRYQTRRPASKPKPKSATNLVVEVQLALRRLGYNPGPADGIAGQATARALVAYKNDYGLPQDNKITRNLLSHMRQNGG